MDACQLEHSVDVDVSLPFAWNWRTDVATWDDPPARFSLDEPFADGAWGQTILPDRPPIRWQVVDVHPRRRFTISLPLESAVLSFEWTFDELSPRCTRMTQRILLSGEKAGDLAPQVQAMFGATIADGMKRLAGAMTAAAKSSAGEP